MAPRAAIRPVAMARAIVSDTGRPSGIADTASTTANRNISCGRWPTATPRRPIRAAAATTATAIERVNRSMRATSGGFPAGRVATSIASSPTLVRSPVATTTADARPRVTIEPA